MQSGGGSSGQGGFNAAQTSQQQTQSNVETGIANATLSNTNQVTPYGDLTYNQSGTTRVGNNDVPSYTATQTLSPEQRVIYDKQTDLSTRALNAASPLMDRVAGTLSTPLSFDGAPGLRGPGVLNQLPGQTMGAANSLNGIDLSYNGPSDPTKLREDGYNALMDRSRTELGRSREGQQVQLANQGIQEGSEAWKRAMEGQDQALVDASNRATIGAGELASQDAGIAGTLAGARSTLAGAQTGVAGTQGQLFGQAGNLQNLGYSQDLSRRNQSLTETQALRNAPLQDYQSLFGLNGGLTPSSFVNTAPGSIPATDVTGPAMAQAQLQAQQRAQQQSGQNSMFGSLASLGGSALGAGAFLWSDERLKENVVPVGETHDGQPLYSYNYKGTSTPQIGLMAQDVERRDPGAVLTTPSGFKAVNYPRALKRSMFGLNV